MKNNKGFSLVELIVVIAIMAILASVAVIGVSVYIPKAKMANDKQLVSDVEYALDLYYQSNAGNMTGGYVVITSGGTTAGGCGTDAMNDVFGVDGWGDKKLASDQWTGAAGMKEVISKYNADDIRNITGSTYFETGSDNLMSAVNVMTNLASKVIADSNIDNAKQNLKFVLGDEVANSIIDTLGDDLLKEPTAISNMLVGAMADTLQSDNGDSDALKMIANDYALAYAYYERTGDDSVITQMQTNLGNMTTITPLISVPAASSMLYEGIANNHPFFNTLGTPQEETDLKALETMMGAVKEISGNFQDRDSLLDDELFVSPGVKEQVNDYFNAIDSLAGMNDEELASLKNLPANANAIVIFISSNGVVSVYPKDAYTP